MPTTRRTSGTFNFENEVVFANTSTRITSTDLTTSDPIVRVNDNQNLSANGAGIEVWDQSANTVVASILYTETANTGVWSFTGTNGVVIDFGNANISIGGDTTYANLEVTSTLTAANVNIANVDINGGYIDNVHLGHDEPVHVHASDVFVDGNLEINGNIEINGTIATGAVGNLANGHLQGNLWGDVKTDDGSTIILYNGSDNTGSNANIRASVLAYDGTVVLNNGTDGTDATFIGDLTGDVTGDVTGTVSSLSNHNTDNLAEGSANLYYTDSRVDDRIATTSIDSLSDVDTSTAIDSSVLTYNSANAQWEPGLLGQAVANFITYSDTSTTAISGITLQSESASSLTANITPESSANTIEVQAQIKYSVRATSSTAFSIKLYRDKGANTEVLLGEDVVYESGNVETIYQTLFNVFDEPADTSSHTYSVYYQANTSSGTLTPNPGTPGKNYIYVTEIINQANILTEIAQDTSPQISPAASSLDLNNKKIINLATPTLGTDAATKTYVDNQVATANELSELTDVNIGTKSTGDALVWTGSEWQAQAPFSQTDFDNAVANTSINSLSDVDTSGATANSILKYNGNTWVVGTDTDTDTGILSVRDDTAPQLGGNLDLNSQSITGTGSIDIIGNIQTIDLIVSGNLTVSGNTTTIDVTQLEVEDPLIYLNRGASDSSTNSKDSGLIIERGSTEDHAGIIWDESADKFKFITSSQSNIATTTEIITSSLANIEFHTSTSINNEAHYADLAELYESDAEYEPGTVMVFGGDKEVTQSNTAMDHRIAGVVSTDPAYLMNSTQTGTAVAVALRGRVPVNVVGPVKKGDLIVSSEIPGVGKAFDGVTNCVFVIGKAIEDDDSENLVRLITCVV